MSYGYIYSFICQNFPKLLKQILYNCYKDISFFLIQGE